MLRSTKDLLTYAVSATDGTIGHVQNFYFDDEAWVIRYLIVDTGTWLSRRKVLISPIAIGHPNRKEKVLPVSITKEQVKNSPDIDTDKPVSRQHEMQYLGYYGYSYYWGGAGLWGGGPSPNMMMPNFATARAAVPSDAERADAERAYVRTEAARDDNDDPHLRDCEAVLRYRIQTSDGDLGHVEGLLVDEETWAIRYIIANTSNWWLGHQVLIAPQWIQEVSWHDATISVNLTRQAVKDAPPYDPAVSLDREHEMCIYEHYARAGYWATEGRPINSQPRRPAAFT
jgi:hypothetical protein